MLRSLTPLWLSTLSDRVKQSTTYLGHEGMSLGSYDETNQSINQLIKQVVQLHVNKPIKEAWLIN